MSVLVTDYKSPLSDKYVYDILTLIWANDKIMASELKRVCSNYDTVKRAAEMLVNIGLLQCYTERGSRLRIIYEETPKGREIAELLMKTRTMLYGEVFLDGVTPPKEESEPEDE